MASTAPPPSHKPALSRAYPPRAQVRGRLVDVKLLAGLLEPGATPSGRADALFLLGGGGGGSGGGCGGGGGFAPGTASLAELLRQQGEAFDELAKAGAGCTADELCCLQV